MKRLAILGMLLASPAFAQAAPDTTPPSVPTGLAAVVVSSTEVDLGWQASTDNVGVKGYRIYENGTQVAAGSGLTLRVTGLTAATTYTFTVAAYDSAGNRSAQSVPVSVTTSGGAPPPPPPSAPTTLFIIPPSTTPPTGSLAVMAPPCQAGYTAFGSWCVSISP